MKELILRYKGLEIDYCFKNKGFIVEGYANLCTTLEEAKELIDYESQLETE